MDGGQVFDINLIDEATLIKNGSITIYRERSLTDETDKLIITTPKNEYHDILMITVV